MPAEAAFVPLAGVPSPQQLPEPAAVVCPHPGLAAQPQQQQQLAAAEALVRRVLGQHAPLFRLALVPPSTTPPQQQQPEQQHEQPAAAASHLPPDEEGQLPQQQQQQPQQQPAPPLHRLLQQSEQQPLGWFSLAVRGGRVHVAGTSGVELACGVHHFLKHWAACSVSWEATGGLQLDAARLAPDALSPLEARGCVTTRRAVRHTFYQNVVTMSYSMAFWEWDRWEAELDWMALQGINLPLMPLGMEALLTSVFGGLGLAPQQLADFFPGPAFLAWGRMGNLQGYAGPLPPAYADKQLALARRVVGRMRALGMTPVYPAFAGFVPRALAQAFPDAAVTPSTCWCHFPPALASPLLLDPADPLYSRIGAAYIAALRAELGWDAGGSYYIADTFNEMRPARSDPDYLSGVAGSVYAGMAAADPGATWVMQAWLFFSDAAFWQPPQIQALLSGVPRGCLLLLDLFADEHPVWVRTAAMYGHPFIWCMLHNFGGNLELYGALPAVASGLAAALAAAPGNLVGLGMAPEGLEQNPAVYECVAEMAYARGALEIAAPGGLEAWFRGYAARRYAAAGRLPPAAAAALGGAWQLLARSVYSCADGAHNTVCDIPTSRPGLARPEITGWGLAPHLWYDVRDVRAAWELLLAAGEAAPALASCSSAFVYDLVDVSRELLSKVAGRFWADAAAAYRAGALPELRAAGAALTGLLADMDGLLGTHAGFMLAPALARARAYAAPNTQQQQQLGDGSTASERQPSPASDCEMPDAPPACPDGSDEAAAAAAAATTTATSRSSSLDSSATEAAVLLEAASSAAAADLLQQQQLGAFYEWNLRTQLTIWGTSAAAGDSEVSDYANKEWAGLISSFYLPRWRAWLARLEADLVSGRPYDAPAWRLEALAMTYRWIATGSTAEQQQPAGTPAAAVAVQELPLEPRGDALALSRAAYERYGRLLAPGCAATAACAAAAAAAAAAGVPVPPHPTTAVVATAAAAAAAAVVGAAGAAAAAVAAAAPPAGGAVAAASAVVEEVHA